MCIDFYPLPKEVVEFECNKLSKPVHPCLLGSKDLPREVKNTQPPIKMMSQIHGDFAPRVGCGALGKVAGKAIPTLAGSKRFARKTSIKTISFNAQHYDFKSHSEELFRFSDWDKPFRVKNNKHIDPIVLRAAKTFNFVDNSEKNVVYTTNGTTKSAYICKPTAYRCKTISSKTSGNKRHYKSKTTKTYNAEFQPAEDISWKFLPKVEPIVEEIIEVPQTNIVLQRFGITLRNKRSEEDISEVKTEEFENCLQFKNLFRKFSPKKVKTTIIHDCVEAPSVLSTNVLTYQMQVDEILPNQTKIFMMVNPQEVLQTEVVEKTQVVEVHEFTSEESDIDFDFSEDKTRRFESNYVRDKKFSTVAKNKSNSTGVVYVKTPKKVVKKVSEETLKAREFVRENKYRFPKSVLDESFKKHPNPEKPDDRTLFGAWNKKRVQAIVSREQFLAKWIKDGGKLLSPAKFVQKPKTNKRTEIVRNGLNKPYMSYFKDGKFSTTTAEDSMLPGESKEYFYIPSFKWVKGGEQPTVRSRAQVIADQRQRIIDAERETQMTEARKRATAAEKRHKTKLAKKGLIELPEEEIQPQPSTSKTVSAPVVQICTAQTSILPPVKTERLVVLKTTPLPVAQAAEREVKKVVLKKPVVKQVAFGTTFTVEQEIPTVEQTQIEEFESSVSQIMIDFKALDGVFEDEEDKTSNWDLYQARGAGLLERASRLTPVDNGHHRCQEFVKRNISEWMSLVQKYAPVFVEQALEETQDFHY